MKTEAQAEDALNCVIVVSGLPRSGTSMIMKMLEKGGVEPITDQVRQADEDNPLGYYEVERMKRLPRQEDRSWISQARGKALKAISHLLKSVPSSLDYQVIFMNRHLDEVLASQNKMLARNGSSTDPSQDEKMRFRYQKHLGEIKTWLSEQPNFRVLYLEYSDVVANPLDQARRISDFLGQTLDTAAMASAVEERLYRNRK